MPVSNPIGVGVGGQLAFERSLSGNGKLGLETREVFGVKGSSTIMPGDMSSSKYELEDYVYEMECRSGGGGGGSGGEGGGGQEVVESAEDVFARLAQKERDLILAAELGKALLERNELLVQQNERLAEDYSHKLEILEQEKHGLRRKLTAAESEYELKVQELALDLNHAKTDLHDQRDSLRQNERDKSQLIDQLTEQNQRLTSQLKEQSKHEHQLDSQLQLLRDQFQLRKSNMSDQVSTLEMLREEINLLSDKKLELERRIDSLLNEREDLSVTLDESSDRIIMLEKQTKEQDAVLRNNQRDIDDLRHHNVFLNDRLEGFSRNSSSPSMEQTSLRNEIDMSDQEVSRPHSHPSLPEDLIELDEEDIECDDPILSPTSDSLTLRAGTSLRQEVIDSVGQIRVLIDQLRHRRRNSLTSLSTNSSDDLTPDKLKAGVLGSVVRELQGLVRNILRREAQGQCGACGRGGEDRVQLEQEVHRALEAVDKLNIELNDTKDKLKVKTDEASDLQHQVTLGEAKLKAVSEHRDNLKHDLENTHLAKDELIKKAWDMRDNAVSRKNACEIELARTRIDVMQINSQLMEAIQQKVELSQQLEQWQVDMQQLLDEQMRRKLSKLEMNGGVGTSSRAQNQTNGSDSDSSCSGKTSPRKNSRLFSLLTTLKR